MINASDGKRDFFISYNKADLPWAEWVGSTLEADGFSVLLSEWDAKGNFVTFMEEAHRRTERTVALLSDNYHGSDFTAGEWTARYARDVQPRREQWTRQRYESLRSRPQLENGAGISKGGTGWRGLTRH